MTAVLINAALIFVLRVCDVSLGTTRTIMVTRGHRYWAALIGFVEVTIWVVAISRVLGHLDHPAYILAYSGGFASGTLCGMWLTDRLAIGYVNVRIISLQKSAELTEALRAAGHGVTSVPAHGRSGPVSLISVVAPRRRVGAIVSLAKATDDKAFVTVDEARQVIGGYQPGAK